MGRGFWFWDHFDDIGKAFGSIFSGEASKNWNSLTQQQKNDLFSNILAPGLDLNGSTAAQTQFENQLTLNRDAQAFNAAEAEKQREWEEQMSNTAYQRQVADMQAAGLNPYAMMAQGYSVGGVPSGSSASQSSGSADMANNKMAAAAGVIAIFLRYLLAKH